ncbi:MAG TPA: VTT domain-containing protein [Candidatus Dormibacteraeota bacterium]|nr:VTT domain-containing protein [Candidatus Dormibacteraeota bacterium]
MPTLIRFLVNHGYVVLFVWVLLEQGGLPIPSIPLLLAAGALAGAGKLNLALSLTLPVAASMISDVCWYEIGKRRGGSVLNLICRISLEPDSCARRTEDLYARLGAKSLFIARFVPGLSSVAPPLAGIFRMRLSRFLVYDALGGVLWSVTFIGLGFVFSSELERIAKYALRLGEMLVFLLVTALTAYILYKYIQRRRFLRGLRIARITPEELKRMLDAGENIQIIDLRHSVEFEADPLTIPGALRLDPKEIEKRQQEIPRDRDVVLYCT